MDKRGATAIEYGLIAALIAVAVIGVLQGLDVAFKERPVFKVPDTDVNTFRMQGAEWVIACEGGEFNISTNTITCAGGRLTYLSKT